MADVVAPQHRQQEAEDAQADDVPGAVIDPAPPHAADGTSAVSTSCCEPAKCSTSVLATAIPPVGLTSNSHCPNILAHAQSLSGGSAASADDYAGGISTLSIMYTVALAVDTPPQTTSALPTLRLLP